jgi:hypothetical protein
MPNGLTPCHWDSFDGPRTNTDNGGNCPEMSGATVSPRSFHFLSIHLDPITRARARAPNFQGGPPAGSGIPFEAWRSWHHMAVSSDAAGITMEDAACRRTSRGTDRAHVTTSRPARSCGLISAGETRRDTPAKSRL